MSAITIEGDLIHYEKLGRGRPVILVHGWVGSWRYWIPLMQQLHVRFSVYTLDLLGFGDSAKNPAGYSIDMQVQLLSKFMEQLAIPKAAMIGHGLGSLVLARFAQLYPDRAARVLLISAPIFDPGNLKDRVPSPVKLATSSVAAPTGIPAAPSTAFNPTAPMVATQAAPTPPAGTPPVRAVGTFNPLTEIISDKTIYALLEKCFKKSDPTYEKLRVDVEKADGAALVASVRGFDGSRFLDELRSLTCPTVAVHGVDDPVIPAPVDAVWNYLTMDRDDQFVPIPITGVRHFPMLEYEPFMRLAGDFLDAPDIAKLEVRDRWRRRSR